MSIYSCIDYLVEQKNKPLPGSVALKINEILNNLIPLAEKNNLDSNEIESLTNSIVEMNSLYDCHNINRYFLESVHKDLIVCLIRSNPQYVPSIIFLKRLEWLKSHPFYKKQKLSLLDNIEKTLKDNPTLTSAQMLSMQSEMLTYTKENELPQEPKHFSLLYLEGVPVIGIIARFVANRINLYRLKTYYQQLSQIPSANFIEELDVFMGWMMTKAGADEEKIEFDSSYKNMRLSMATNQCEGSWRAGLSAFCYGYGVEYTKHNLTNTRKTFEYGEITTDIYTAQKLQRNRLDDWHNLPSKRLIPMHQQSHPSKWLIELHQQLDMFKDRHFSIVLKQESAGKHDQRISLKEDGKILFFDSNYGSFEFNDKDQFNRFYLDLLGDYKRTGYIVDMFELKINNLPGSNESQNLQPSISGKWTSLMYGTKYGTWCGLRNLTTVHRFFDSYNKSGIYADDYEANASLNRNIPN